MAFIYLSNPIPAYPYLHVAPFFSLHPAPQQGSEMLQSMPPQSHSSSPSTMPSPQWGSVVHPMLKKTMKRRRDEEMKRRRDEEAVIQWLV